ncbi:hypothetical protein LVJ94_27575 [Pendulispora rubella]|uniref:Uncharacterized protein n=1 Tax=Pendulispora rubella TaxID=2741070 RepID=A0ABZ2KWK1_9BACT
MSGRWLAVFVGMMVVIGAGYTWHARQRHARAAVPVAPGPAISLRTPGQLFFRNTEPGPHFGRVAAVPIEQLGQVTPPRRVFDAECDRFAVAAGVGLCVAQQPGVLPPMSDVRILDQDLHVVRQRALPGTVSRAKLSSDGKLAVWTLFVMGDDYSEDRFSTRAGIWDLTTDEFTKTLEDMPVSVGGKRYFSSDVNFWGITFAGDDTRFYATMASKGRTHLVQGDYRLFRARALEENVECPSLSPDGKRIAFKRRESPNATTWRLSVMDLATRAITALAETHSVDDQAAWLDERTVMYGLSRERRESDVWAVPADGSGAPRLLVAGAASPALVYP